MTSQIEILSKKFNDLLNEYKETYQKFIDVVDTNDNSLIDVPNSTYNGTNNIKLINYSSLNNCMSSCKTTDLCTGATFDDLTKACTLSTGLGSIIETADTNNTAIVNQPLYYSYKLKKINEELMDVNNSIINLNNSKTADYSNNKQTENKNSETLNTNYQILEKERYEIEQMIIQYNTLQTAYDNGNINVTSNYYAYIMYLLIVVFFIYILLKFNFSSQQVGGSNNSLVNKIVPLIILSFIIIFNSIIKN